MMHLLIVALSFCTSCIQFKSRVKEPKIRPNIDFISLDDLRHDISKTANLINVPDQPQQIAAMRQELHCRLSQTNGLSIPL